MKFRRISIILLFIFLVLSISCYKKEAEWKGTIEQIDSVTVVKNPKEPNYFSFSSSTM
jgi:hypothetical protein